MQKSLFILKTLLFSLLFTLSSVNASAGMFDEGVSLQLAQHRKAEISNLRYDLRFNIPGNKQSAIEAEETLLFTLPRKDSIVIDFRESADKIHGIRVNGRHCQYLFVNEHIVILPKYSLKGENTVSITFTAGNQSLNRRDGYVYTLFVPDRARTVFPCFEQPNLKGLFTLHLTIPKQWKAVTNTYQQSEKTDGDVKTIDFAQTEPLSTYLFAFAAGDFQYQTYTGTINANGTSRQMTIGAYYRETDKKRIAQLPDIFKQVMFALQWQEQFTAMPYPFAKYDLVVLPGFQFGGMEHTGCTFYNDNTLFLPENPTPDEQLSRTQLISHETTHMWFGDAVTMDWFSDVWTKEVFANYFAAEITEPLFPDLDHKLNWLRTYQGAAISQDRTDGRTSIRQDLDNMRNAGLVYNNIIYNKAPVMMRKMVALMGREAYRRGIQEYVRRYKYGNATWDDLVNILDAETPVDLKSFSKDWVDTPMWPTRKAKTYSDAFDIDYYGYTEMTEDQTDELCKQIFSDSTISQSQVMAALMTVNENYLCKTIPARNAVEIMLMFACSDNPLICSAAISYLREPLRECNGNSDCYGYEQRLLELVNKHPLPSARTQTLRLLISQATSPAVVDTLYAIWQKGTSPYLSINDFMTLSYELAVRMPARADSIITAHRSRITNPDRLRQFDFISRAVSPLQSERDSLFASLRNPDNRRIEPWTLSVLYYLNHPLRQKESVKYIRPALDMLPDVQRTGDIFFPGNWCSYLLSGHRSPEAYQEVQEYLKDNNNLLPLLRNKVLSAEYNLQRVNK